MIDIKHCQCCGKPISNIDTADYYSHISIKYCAKCSEFMKRVNTLARVKNLRDRKRIKDKYRDEQLELLKQENELLRERITALRINNTQI